MSAVVAAVYRVALATAVEAQLLRSKVLPDDLEIIQRFRSYKRGATTFTVFTATVTNRRKVLDAARIATISSAKICNSRVLPLRFTETRDLNPDGCFVSGRRDL